MSQSESDCPVLSNFKKSFKGKRQSKWKGKVIFELEIKAEGNRNFSFWTEIE